MRIRLTVVRGKEAPRLMDVEAANVHAARLRVQSEGYTVLSSSLPASASALASARLEGLWKTWGAGISVGGGPAQRSTWDLVVFAEQLRDLLQAGLSVIEALETVQRGSPSSILSSLVRHLRDGLPLSQAMASEPAFPPLLVALVKASELTSDLPQSLARYIDHEKRVAELRHRIRSVALYPLLLIGVGGLVLLFLLFYVMPRFARIFEGMNGDLPWSANAMVAWAHLLRDHQSAVLIGFAVSLALLVSSLGVPAWRKRLKSRVLELGPFRLIQEPLFTYHMARWYRATGMLVQGGIPLPQALALASALLPEHLKEQGHGAEDAIRQGLAPSAAYLKVGMATPVAEQLMLAAERTGDLGSVLERVARFHENDVGRRLERGMKVLEPVVMLGIGVGVGLVVVLMYMPIFELASSIQ